MSSAATLPAPNMLAPEAVKRRLGFHHRRERSHDGLARFDRERSLAAANSGPRARLRAVLEGHIIDLVLHEFSGGFPLSFTATTEGVTHRCTAAGPGDMPCKMVIELPKNISCRFPRVALSFASKSARGSLTLTIDEFGVDGWCALTPLVAPATTPLPSRPRSLSDSSPHHNRKMARAAAAATTTTPNAENTAPTTTTTNTTTTGTNASTSTSTNASSATTTTTTTAAPSTTKSASPSVTATGPPRTPQPTRSSLGLLSSTLTPPTTTSPLASPMVTRTPTPTSAMFHTAPLLASTAAATTAAVLERQYAAASLKAAAAERNLHQRQLDQLRKTLGDEINDLRRRLRDAEDVAAEAARQQYAAERKAAALRETVAHQARELRELHDQTHELHELAAAAEVDEASSAAVLRAENEWLREQLQRCADVLRTAHVTALMKGALGRVRKVRTELSGAPGSAADSEDCASASQSPVHIHVSNHPARMSLFTRQDSGQDSSGHQSPACSGRTSPVSASPIAPRPRHHASRAKEHSSLTAGNKADHIFSSPERESSWARSRRLASPDACDTPLSLADDLRLSGESVPHPSMLSSPAPSAALVAETEALEHQLDMLASSLLV